LTIARALDSSFESLDVRVIRMLKNLPLLGPKERG